MALCFRVALVWESGELAGVSVGVLVDVPRGFIVDGREVVCC